MSSIPYIKSVENKFFTMKTKAPIHPLGSAAPKRTSSREMNTSFGFVKEYGTSLEGIVRILLIVSLTAGWISGACISRAYVYDASNEDTKKYVYTSFEHFLQTRTAFVIIAVLAMLASMVDFFVNIGNVDNMKYFRKMKFDWMVISLKIFIRSLFVSNLIMLSLFT